MSKTQENEKVFDEKVVFDNNGDYKVVKEDSAAVKDETETSAPMDTITPITKEKKSLGTKKLTKSKTPTEINDNSKESVMPEKPAETEKVSGLKPLNLDSSASQVKANEDAKQGTPLNLDSLRKSLEGSNQPVDVKPAEEKKETSVPKPTEEKKETSVPKPTEEKKETSVPKPTEEKKETPVPKPTEEKKETLVPKPTEEKKEVSVSKTLEKMNLTSNKPLPENTAKPVEEKKETPKPAVEKVSEFTLSPFKEICDKLNYNIASFITSIKNNISTLVVSPQDRFCYANAKSLIIHGVRPLNENNTNVVLHIETVSNGHAVISITGSTYKDCEANISPGKLITANVGGSSIALCSLAFAPAVRYIK